MHSGYASQIVTRNIAISDVFRLTDCLTCIFAILKMDDEWIPSRLPADFSTSYWERIHLQILILSTCSPLASSSHWIRHSHLHSLFRLFTTSWQQNSHWASNGLMFMHEITFFDMVTDSTSGGFTCMVFFQACRTRVVFPFNLLPFQLGKTFALTIRKREMANRRRLSREVPELLTCALKRKVCSTFGKSLVEQMANWE